MGKSKLILTPRDGGLELSREEYADAETTPPWRYERANGRLVVMVPPGHDHHSTVQPFRDYLGAYRLAHSDVVEYVFQESWTAVDQDTDRLPDIAVYLRGRDDRIPERVPELVFEIVSESNQDRKRDYDEKREEYQRLGVREYVIVDRFEHRLTIFRIQDGYYGETILGPDDTYTSPLLPGLEIPLTGII